MAKGTDSQVRPAVAVATASQLGWTQTAETLALFRIVYAFSILWGWSRASVRDLAEIPADLFHPPLGPFQLLHGWPPEVVLVAVEAVGVVALVALLFGAWTRQAALVVAGAALVTSGLRFATGKIDHDLLVFVAVPAILAWSTWGDRWSVDAGRSRVRRRPGFATPSRRPVQVLALTVGLMFATSGLTKAMTGWLELGGSATRGWLFQYVGRTWLGERLVDVPWPAMWQASDLATVVVEAGVLVAAYRRRWFARYLPLVLVLHLSINFVFGINFEAIVVVYLAFVRLDTLAGRIRPTLDRVEQLLARTGPALVAASVVAWLFAAFLVEHGRIPGVLYQLANVGVPFAGLLPWIGAAAGALWLWRRSAPREADDRMPRWLYGTACGLLAAQVTVLLTVSEPYPAPAGPLFMGNPDRGGETVSFRQAFRLVDADGTEVRVSAGEALPTRYATHLRHVRFPLPDLDDNGWPTKDPTWINQRRWQGHRFTSTHLDEWGGKLTATEAAWISDGLKDSGYTCGDRCRLLVRWYREATDTATGEPVSQNVIGETTYPLNGWSPTGR